MPLAFLQDEDGALSFWVQVLGVPLDHVRTLIGRALNGHGNSHGRGPKCAKNPLILLAESWLRRGTIGVGPMV